MKKLIITASILLIQWTCTAQKFETIDTNELTINGVGFTEYNGDSVIPLIVSTFGQPDAKKRYIDEYSDDIVEKYTYNTYNNGLILYITGNYLALFTITGSSYTFTSHNIRVGDNISRLASIYPLSYENRFEYYSEKIIQLDLDDTDNDIILFFYDSNDRIVRIEERVYD